MNRKSLFTLFITLMMIGSFLFPTLSVIGQSEQAPKQSNEENDLKALTKATRIVERYRESSEQNGKGRKHLAQKQERPQWAEQALRRSLEQLQQRKGKYGIRDADSEFRMLEAMKDGRGYMDVRLAQMHNGVEVFGGQLIAHLDDQNSLRAVSGRMFEEARINTTAKIDETQAIESAKAALQHTGEFDQEPTARLVILPHRIMKNDKTATGATLVYMVKLNVESGEKAGDYQFFISARNGSVVWKINARNSAFGIGGSLYSGAVELNVDFNPNTGYTLRDPDRGHSEVFDSLDNSDTDFARPFGPKTPAAWGNVGDASNRETVAVDALFGLERTWDYFFSTHGRWGTDGIGAGVDIFVHYVHPNDLGINGGSGTTNNAYGGHNSLKFGSGDGTAFGPLVSLDIVGHEYTHCLIDDTLFDDGFIYSGESGAIDESFCDIFGTAIEFYTASINGREPDYLIGEDAITPNTLGDALRDMQNPANSNQPDHYTNFVNTTSDNGGVHTNSGIMNHVYYLLSEGATHRNGTFVPSIGRGVTEYLFYQALVRWLTPSATFEDVAQAMRQVALDDFPDRSAVAAVELAWFAVGVFQNDDLFYSLPRFPNLDRGRIVLYEPATGFAETGRLDYQSGLYQKLQNVTGAT
ncbi:MAG TPA: M4 family metallopeptidase, partial [Blastocatellia bacterium]